MGLLDAEYSGNESSWFNLDDMFWGDDLDYGESTYSETPFFSGGMGATEGDISFSWEDFAAEPELAGIDDDLESFFSEYDKLATEEIEEDNGLWKNIKGLASSPAMTKLLEFGTGFLTQYLLDKNKKTSSRGGGGGRGPQTAVTSSIPKGTRTKAAS